MRASCAAMTTESLLAPPPHIHRSYSFTPGVTLDSPWRAPPETPQATAEASPATAETSPQSGQSSSVATPGIMFPGIYHSSSQRCPAPSSKLLEKI